MTNDLTMFFHRLDADVQVCCAADPPTTQIVDQRCCHCDLFVHASPSNSESQDPCLARSAIFRHATISLP